MPEDTAGTTQEVPPPAPAEVEADTIPANLRGNWGMNAADCEGGASAKGLLEIDGTTLTFYESVGTLENVDNASPGSIQAEFAFEGEGMEWYLNGKLRYEGMFKGDRLYEGFAFWYYVDSGALKMRADYVKGRLVRGLHWDRNGDLFR